MYNGGGYNTQMFNAGGTQGTQWMLQLTEPSEILTIPTINTIHSAEGALEIQVCLARAPGGVPQMVFDGAGIVNANLQVYVRPDGRPAVGYGVGASTVELIGGTVFLRDIAYALAVHWSSSGVALFVGGQQEAASNVKHSITFGSIAFIGSRADGAMPLDGFVRDLRVSSRALTDSEIAAAFAAREWALGADTTFLMPMHSDLSVTSTPAWISPVIDCSDATNKAGRAEVTSVLPAGSAITVQTRGAPSSEGPWSPWVALLPDNTFQHPASSFVQVRVAPVSSGENIPRLLSLNVVFDRTIAGERIATGLASSRMYFCDMLRGQAIVVNGAGAPQTYNGTTMMPLPGSPPIAQFVATHRNYLFMAATNLSPSRLFFSAPLNVESWPVLNFIDISPDDGDRITGLLSFGDQLLIAKERSVWALMGSGPSDFSVVRVYSGHGTIAPRSFIRAGERFCLVAPDGVYLADLAAPVLVTDKVAQTWRGLNRRRLRIAAAEYYDHKLRISVPQRQSLVNSEHIVFDEQHNALHLERFSRVASCFAKFIDTGEEILLFGHTNETQVSRLEYGTSDNGAPIRSEWVTRQLEFGSPALIKRVRNLFLVVSSTALSSTEVQVFLEVDGQMMPAGERVIVPAMTNRNIHTMRVRVRGMNVRNVRTLAYRLVQSVTNGGVDFHELLQEFMPRRVRPT